jgi:stage IV sporulation protein FB
MAHPEYFPEIRIHPFAASGLFLLLFVTPNDYAFAVLSSVILHEMGHLIASLLYHKHPTFVKLMPTGISIGLLSSSSYTEELVIAAAGPLMNLLYCATAVFFPYTLSKTVWTVSLLLCLLNLLPITTFDGGRMLGASAALLFGEIFSERLLRLTTAVCLVCLWVLSLYVFFYSGINMTLLVFCAYLFSYLILKKA